MPTRLISIRQVTDYCKWRFTRCTSVGDACCELAPLFVILLYCGTSFSASLADAFLSNYLQLFILFRPRPSCMNKVKYSAGKRDTKYINWLICFVLRFPVLYLTEVKCNGALKSGKHRDAVKILGSRGSKKRLQKAKLRELLNYKKITRTNSFTGIFFDPQKLIQ